jgi:hypothetical protein
MRQRLRTYTAYSVACFIVWAVILITVAAGGTGDRLQKFLYVFGGWTIGWLSATIARSVYPPPRVRR